MLDNLPVQQVANIFVGSGGEAFANTTDPLATLIGQTETITGSVAVVSKVGLQIRRGPRFIEGSGLAPPPGSIPEYRIGRAPPIMYQNFANAQDMQTPYTAANLVESILGAPSLVTGTSSFIGRC